MAMMDFGIKRIHFYSVFTGSPPSYGQSPVICPFRMGRTRRSAPTMNTGYLFPRLPAFLKRASTRLITASYTASRWQTAVNNAEVIVLPAAGKQYRVVVEGVSCGLAPATTRKRLIYAVIVQLRPEQ